MDRLRRFANRSGTNRKEPLGFCPEIAAIAFLVGLAWLNALGQLT